MDGTSFKNEDDVYRYLNNTVCMYGGRPVVVKTMPSITKVRISYVGQNIQWKDIEIADEQFHTFPFELGFLNMKGQGVGFLSRSGTRNSNYGLHLGYIVSEAFDAPFGVDTNTSREFMLNCLMNIYPSFDKAANSIKENCKSVAFHKYYALMCVEKDDPDLIGIHYMNNTNPFAILDTKTNTIEVSMKTKKNRALFSVACKSGIIPSSYL